MHVITMGILLRVIFDNLIEHVLEVKFSSLLLIEDLEFTWKLFNLVVFVLHLYQLVESLKLIEALVASNNRFTINVNLDDILLNIFL